MNQKELVHAPSLNKAPGHNDDAVIVVVAVTTLAPSPLEALLVALVVANYMANAIFSEGTRPFVTL